MHDEPMLIYRRPRNTIMLGGLAVFGFALSAWMTVEQYRSGGLLAPRGLYAVLGLAVTVAALPILVRRLRQRGPAIEIGPQGIAFGEGHPKQLPWAAIVRIETRVESFQHMLKIYHHRGDRDGAHLVELSLSGMTVKPLDIVAAIERHCCRLPPDLADGRRPQT